MLRLTIIIVINILAIFLVKFAYKRFHLSSYLLRKAIHLFVALVAIGATFFLTKTEFVLSALVMSLLYGVIYFKKLLPELELKNFKNYGLFLYPVGLLVLGLFLYSNLAALRAGILILGLPDSAASIFDHLRGKRHKTASAGLIYFLFAAPVLIFVFKPIYAIIFAAILALTERKSRAGFDDLTVPIVYVILAGLYAYVNLPF